MPENDIVEICHKQNITNEGGGDSIVSLQSTDGEGEEASLEIDIKEDQKHSSKRLQDSASDTSTKRGADSDSLGTVIVILFALLVVFLLYIANLRPQRRLPKKQEPSPNHS